MSESERMGGRIEEGDRTQKMNVCGRSTRMNNEHRDKITKGNRFLSKTTCPFCLTIFHFIVVQGERIGGDDASWCFTRAWTVTPVFGKFEESVRAVRCILNLYDEDDRNIISMWDRRDELYL